MSVQCDAGGAVGATLLVAFAIVGLFAGSYLLFDGPENNVAANCKKDGYWQYGQERFICHLDTTKYKIEENEFQVKN